MITLSEYIKLLQAIETEHGGDLPVVIYDHENWYYRVTAEEPSIEEGQDVDEIGSKIAKMVTLY